MYVFCESLVVITVVEADTDPSLLEDHLKTMIGT
jgi:hypothetical protein